MKRFKRKIFSFQGIAEVNTRRKSGDNSVEATPVPIPNTEVKLYSADDTWRATAWESRTLPVCIKRPEKTLSQVFFLNFADFKVK